MPEARNPKSSLGALERRDFLKFGPLAFFGVNLARSAASDKKEDAELPKTRLVASEPSTWRPVPYRAVAPNGGVTLADDGLFTPVMERNITYLLESFSVEHMLVPFRLRAGNANPPDDHPDAGNFWDYDLRGSWADGDTITFTLPMDFRITQYAGLDQIPGHRRFAIEFGPILHAATGPLDAHSAVTIVHEPATSVDG